MSNAELARLRVALGTEALPSSPDTISALRLPSCDRYYLGLTHDGHVCALIETQADARGPNIRLRNLEIRQAVRCRVREPGTDERVIQGSLVTCHTLQPALTDLFVRLYSDAVDDLGPSPTSASIASWLARLAELLSKLEEGGGRTLQGLWAELLLIRELGDPLLLLRRWRPDKRERYDFLGPGFALEVKSCQDFERIHQFSLEQLRPPDSLEVWIASVVVRRDPTGMSVLELVKDIEALLPDPAARELLRTTSLSTGGSALDDDDEFRFDYRLASDSVRFMHVAEVPSIQGPLHQDILSVSLGVKCANVAEIGQRADAIRKLSGL